VVQKAILLELMLSIALGFDWPLLLLRMFSNGSAIGRYIVRPAIQPGILLKAS
jgi:hypothetical protein